jgi:beta-1,4-N-acetylglucosaminyltransferase
VARVIQPANSDADGHPAANQQQAQRAAQHMDTPQTTERPHTTKEDPVDVLLVCSAGGHLLQLTLLSAAWQGMSHAWVTLEREDARMLSGERVYYAHGPTERNIPNLIRNIGFAWNLTRRLRPKAIVTTGAGLAVPFAWVGRAHGAKIVFIESLTRINEPSVSYRLIRPVTNRVYMQWPELAAVVRKARYAGNVLEHT